MPPSSCWRASGGETRSRAGATAHSRDAQRAEVDCEYAGAMKHGSRRAMSSQAPPCGPFTPQRANGAAAAERTPPSLTSADSAIAHPNQKSSTAAPNLLSYFLRIRRRGPAPHGTRHLPVSTRPSGLVRRPAPPARPGKCRSPAPPAPPEIRSSLSPRAADAAGPDWTAPISGSPHPRRRSARPQRPGRERRAAPVAVQTSTLNTTRETTR
jgi:hypothetical protein